MLELLGLIVGQAVGVLLWSLLNASILQWRARKIKAWAINFKQAYFLSLKAGLVALVVGDAAVFAITFSGSSSEDLLKYVGLLFGLVSWWFTHSNALLKLAGPSLPLTVKEARAISASVFGYLFGALFALSLVLVLLLSLFSALK